MATMNISLPDQMKAWVEAQTQTGDYANASDYVRDLIRRDRERRQALNEIQELLDEGMNSGPPFEFDSEAFLKRMHERHNAKQSV